MTAALVLTVVAAGAVGALARYLVSRAFGQGRQFPWAVLTVNVVGSAIGGAVLAFVESGAVGSDIRLVLLTGLCGGLSTFSTFSVETVQRVLDGKARLALLSIAANLVLGIGAAAGAYLLVGAAF